MLVAVAYEGLEKPISTFIKSGLKINLIDAEKTLYNRSSIFFTVTPLGLHNHVGGSYFAEMEIYLFS